MKKIQLMLILLFVSFVAKAQNISVESFHLLPNDLSANIEGSLRFDPNTRKNAALIKVVTTEKDFYFDGGMMGLVGDPVQKVGEIWVYVPEGSKQITIQHQNLGVLRNYHYPEAIRSGKTYEMTLTTGSVITHVIEDVGGHYVSIKVTPANSQLLIDNEIKTLDANGELSEFIKGYGRHEYKISSNLYETEIGTFNIERDKKTDLVINLRPAYTVLNIATEPSGASVYIDDEHIGETPLTTKRLSKGSHQLRYSMPMYKTKLVNVNLLGDGSTQYLKETLDANFATVTLSVPNQAEIYVNNEKKGVGNWTGKLNAGDYVVEARKASHHSVKTTIRVSAGEQVTKQLDAPIPRYGSLDITSSPINAKVLVDGKDMGTTPNIFKEILIGQREITLIKDGYAIITKTISIAEGEITHENVKLENAGVLKINSSKAGAVVYLDGKHIGQAPCSINATSGTHTVTVKAYDCKDQTQVVTVEAGKTRSYTINPVSNNGTTRISSNVTSDVYVGGRRIGTTPYSYQAPTGKYSVTLSSSGYKSKTEDVEVISGAYNEQNINLKRKRTINGPMDPGDWFSFGFTLDCSFVNNMTFGANAVLKIGQEKYSWLTFSAGVGYHLDLKVKDDLGLIIPNYDPEAEMEGTSISRIPLLMSLRLRLAGGDWTYDDWTIFAGPRCHFNFNSGPDYDTNIVNGFNYSLGGEIGWIYKRGFDMSLYFLYDMKPFYNQEYLYNNYREYYTTCLDKINARWTMGITIGVHIPFSW